jgi:hypothetical protein
MEFPTAPRPTAPLLILLSMQGAPCFKHAVINLSRTLIQSAHCDCAISRIRDAVRTNVEWAGRRDEPRRGGGRHEISVWC